METDESHLVRDHTGLKYRRSKLRVAIWFCVADCGLALSSNDRIPVLRSPCRFLRIASFNFDRVTQYRVALMFPTSNKSTQNVRDYCWPGFWNVGANRDDFGRIAVFWRRGLLDPGVYGQRGRESLVFGSGGAKLCWGEAGVVWCNREE
ncbi:hypothetical protein TNCV_1289581 [Trichonephila clavipes]|nr:hypothetical protein TNCV_1289581 [Trichonephila clavipes]